MYKQVSLSAVLLALFSCGQTTSHTPQPGKADSSKQPSRVIDSAVKILLADTALFIPKGYSILDTATGDLNLDPYPDMILVLKKGGEDTSSDVTEHPEKRPLLILIGQPDGHLKLVSKSDNAVYCIDCGGVMGDPFTQIVIKNGYFSVEHYGGSSWRWSRTTTFHYSSADKSWYLHKDVSESFHASDPEKGKQPFIRQRIFAKFGWINLTFTKKTNTGVVIADLS